MPVLKYIFLLPFLWLPSTALAHPHILIDAQVEFHISQSAANQYQLDSLKYTWQFDENFSLLLVGDYDDDKNQLLNQQELTTMGIETMEGAKELGYFTAIKDGDKHIKPEDAPQVLATYKDNRLTLAFDIKLPNSITISDGFDFSLFDEEYYTAFMFKQQDGYQIISSDAHTCKIFQATSGEIDDNIRTSLESDFGQDMTNLGMGAQFADSVGIKCS